MRSIPSFEAVGMRRAKSTDTYCTETSCRQQPRAGHQTLHLRELESHARCKLQPIGVGFLGRGSEYRADLVDSVCFAAARKQGSEHVELCEDSNE